MMSNASLEADAYRYVRLSYELMVCGDVSVSSEIVAVHRRLRAASPRGSSIAAGAWEIHQSPYGICHITSIKGEPTNG